MVGRVSLAIGLAFAGVFMIAIGYFLTLNVYQNVGSEVIFYYGRYYGGIACMTVGGILIFTGILLPMIWPVEKQRKPPQMHEKRPHTPEPPPPAEPALLPAKSSVTRSVELKIKGISMQSTCGTESIQILRLLSHGMKRLSLSDMFKETGFDQSRMKKAISLLVDLNLIKRSDLADGEGYVIPPTIENEVVQGIRKVCGQK